MNVRLWKKTIAYGLASVVLLAVLAAATFRERSDRLERRQVQVVMLGDSVFGLIRDDTSIPAQIERALGKSVFNGAFGGTCISRIDKDHRLTNARDSLSLAGLTKAIAADDFGAQQTVRTRESSTEYFEDTVDELEKIDFSSVELVIIMHGFNDFYSGVPIYNEEDPLDEYSFTGALQSSLLALRKVNPNMRILLVTPTFSWHIQSGLTCEEFNGGYGVQEDYIKAEAEVAEALGVELIDVYHGLFLHEKWEDWSMYTFDGLHPNEAGRELLTNIIYEYLQENP